MTKLQLVWQLIITEIRIKKTVVYKKKPVWYVLCLGVYCSNAVYHCIFDEYSARHCQINMLNFVTVDLTPIILCNQKNTYSLLLGHIL